MASVAIYARFLREWYTPLSPGVHTPITWLTKSIVPDGHSQPRSKLVDGNWWNCKESFQDNHKEKIKLSDSQVTFNWINNREKRVKNGSET